MDTNKTQDRVRKFALFHLTGCEVIENDLNDLNLEVIKVLEGSQEESWIQIFMKDFHIYKTDDGALHVDTYRVYVNEQGQDTTGDSAEAKLVLCKFGGYLKNE